MQDFPALRRPVYLRPSGPILPFEGLPQLHRKRPPTGQRHRHFRHRPLHIADKPTIVDIASLQLRRMAQIDVMDLKPEVQPMCFLFRNRRGK